LQSIACEVEKAPARGGWQDSGDAPRRRRRLDARAPLREGSGWAPRAPSRAMGSRPPARGGPDPTRRGPPRGPTAPTSWRAPR